MIKTVLTRLGWWLVRWLVHQLTVYGDTPPGLDDEPDEDNLPDARLDQSGEPVTLREGDHSTIRRGLVDTRDEERWLERPKPFRAPGSVVSVRVAPALHHLIGDPDQVTVGTGPDAYLVPCSVDPELTGDQGAIHMSDGRVYRADQVDIENGTAYELTVEQP